MNKFIILLLLGMATVASSQNMSTPSYFSQSAKVFTGADGAPSSTIDFIDLQIDKLRDGVALNETNASAKIYLKLNLGEDFVSTGSAIVYTISYTVDIIGSVATSSHSGSLAITEINPEQLVEINLLSEFNNTDDLASTITVNITDVAMSLTSPITDNYVIANAQVSATLIREYKVDVRLDASQTMAPGVQLINPEPNTGRLVHFVWNANSSEEFPNYEIQILRVYNTNPSVSYAGVTAEVDWNKALRVETRSSEKSIDLTVAEGTGFYIWRVRPIGNFYAGGIANQENYGLWNASSIAQGSLETFSSSDVLTRSDVFFINDQDENINWIYNRVFTEGNTDPSNTKTKMSEGMSYADGLLRARQTQAFNSANDTTLVTQTVSDYSGRPALTTLPVPVANGLTGYKVGFVQADLDGSPGGQTRLYTALDYDDGALVKDPTKIHDNDPALSAIDPQPAFGYYDGTEANGVADAEGYAFKRTLFKTDGTGRVDEESGVGRMHALGSQGNGGGKTTRILFGTPSDDELIRIFGDEAPLAESVIKTLTIDPNEVVSVTYTSKEGKTIATALIETDLNSNNDPTDDNLLPLNEASTTLTVNNTANQNIVSNNKMISSRRIALEVDKVVTLFYDNTNPISMGGCAGGDCGLKLRFYLNDLKNGQTYISNANMLDEEVNLFDVGTTIDFSVFNNWGWVNLDPTGTAFSGTITAPLTTNTTTFELEAGEYIITKEVFSTNSPDFVAENMVAYSENYTPILNALADTIANVVNPDQYADFENIFLPELAALISDYHAVLPSTGNPAVPILPNATTSPSTITTEIQDASDTLVNYLGMDVLISVTPADPDFVPYIFPPDFSIPADLDNTNSFMSGDALDPSQNTLTVNLGCCDPLAIPMPKPEVCLVCEGEVAEDFGGELAIETIKADILHSITYDLPLAYGINDIRKNINSVFNNTGNTWTYTKASLDWEAINDLVSHYFMTYLYNRLQAQGFITGFDIYDPTAYPEDNAEETELQDFYDQFAPGFTNESMKYMITNMLISRYYVGQSKESEGSYYRAKENENGWLVFTDVDGEIPTGQGFETADSEVTTDSPHFIVTGFDDADKFNYKCQDLFECWLQAVDLINSFDVGDANIMDGFNDEQGDNASDEHADDDESKEEGNPAIDLITSWIISSKMRGFEDDAGLDKDKILALVSFPKVFLECATYQYSDILDENTAAVPADYDTPAPVPQVGIDPLIISDLSVNLITNGESDYPLTLKRFGTEAPVLVGRDDDGNVVMNSNQGIPSHMIETACGGAYERSLFYPYTLKPEWMFKYFVYNSYSFNGIGDVEDDFMPLMNQFEIQLNACYQDMFTPICITSVPAGKERSVVNQAIFDGDITVDDNPRCGASDCRYYKKSWSTGQRLAFYKQISTGRRCSETNSPLYESLTTTTVIPLTKGDVVAMANGDLDDAVATCDYRRGEFKGRIIDELLAGCWEIVSCSTLTYHITEVQINEMVEKVVVSCKYQVNEVRATLDTWPNDVNGTSPPEEGYGQDIEDHFPKSVDDFCYFVDLASRGCIETKKREITLFPDCDQALLDQINKWNFEPNLGVANLNEDTNYGLNADGTLKDPDDAYGDINGDGIINCEKYSQREWVSCVYQGGVACHNKDCQHLDKDGVPVTDTNGPVMNTYSGVHPINAAP